MKKLETMEDFEFVSGYRRFLKNKQNKWSGRKDDNRIEPECWPAINPKFQIDKTDKIFTIGSCFARNIESHLLKYGFDVKSASMSVPFTNLPEFQILNKYTPASIYQELSWAYNILMRDDVVSDDDVMPLLLKKDNNKWVDMHLLNVGDHSVELHEAIERRKTVYEIFKSVFYCDVVIITLGLIESWWDAKYKQYILSMPDPRWKNIEGRFIFKTQRYVESLDYVSKSIELLIKNNVNRILVTTSPVPLSRTFFNDDVIVRNMYSKSVLRSVAGDICDMYPQVDYFPSYENVILTKQKYVWSDDLAHVSHGFVGKIMNHAMRTYSPGLFEKNSIEPDVQLFVDLVGNRDFASAEIIYHQKLKDENIKDLFFHSCATYLGFIKKDVDIIRRHSGEFIDQYELIVSNDHVSNYFNASGAPVHMYNVFRALVAIEEHDKAAKLKEYLFKYYSGNSYNFILVIMNLINGEFYEEALSLAQEMSLIYPCCADFPRKIMEISDRLGKVDLYNKAVIDLTKLCPNDIYIRNQASKIIENSGNIDEAIMHSSKAYELDFNNAQLCIRYARLLEKARQFENARNVYRHFLNVSSDKDQKVVHAFAMFEKSQGNFKEALALFNQLKDANYSVDGIDENIRYLARQVKTHGT